MSTLVLLLTGPMQSWGERAAFTDRDTLPHPTRSGIIGMLACAQGHSRDHKLDWAKDLTIHVRADSPGHVMSDFHMIGSGYPVERAMITAEGKPRKNKHGQASGTMTTRHYLADAAFTVTVTGDDHALTERLAHALRKPRWPLYLGRKSCPPAHPVVLGITDAGGTHALDSIPAYTPIPRITPSGGPTAENAVNLDDFSPVDDWFTAVATATNQAPTVDRVVYVDRVAPTAAYTVTRDDPASFTRTSRTYRSRHVGQMPVTVPAAGTGVAGWRALRDAVTALARPAVSTI
jgi:CRISPR system Cascade subunit CasD